MCPSGLTEAIQRGQYLLRVIAMCEAENLGEQRLRVLRQLREVEVRVAEYGNFDLYAEILQADLGPEK